MSRGYLIFPFIARIARLDTAATAEDPDAAGPLTSGYDDDYRELVIVPPGSGSGRGTEARQETEIEIPAQIESDTMELADMKATGVSPSSMLRLVIHFSDLERMQLINEQGQPLLKAGDRLVSIKDIDGNLVQEIRTPPGLYCEEALPCGFGLGGSRNLLVMTFKARAVSQEAS